MASDAMAAASALLPDEEVGKDGKAAGRIFEDAAERGIAPGGMLWLPPLEALEGADGAPLVLEYEVYPEVDDSECIAAFSHSKVPWQGGGAGEDALTWYCAPGRNDFTFRSRVFGGFPRCTFTRAKRVAVREWHSVRVGLSVDKAAYTVDGSLFAVAALSSADGVPATGYCGFMSYSTPFRVRNVVLRRGAGAGAGGEAGADGSGGEGAAEGGAEGRETDGKEAETQSLREILAKLARATSVSEAMAALSAILVAPSIADVSKAELIAAGRAAMATIGSEWPHSGAATLLGETLQRFGS